MCKSAVQQKRAIKTNLCLISGPIVFCVLLWLLQGLVTDLLLKDPQFSVRDAVLCCAVLCCAVPVPVPVPVSVPVPVPVPCRCPCRAGAVPVRCLCVRVPVHRVLPNRPWRRQIRLPA
ncbi:hypothetical protein FOA52_014772 [Chlamydomonas sp. UWO 241]|nr:hypothetical protein FOA52_014772 [Chlamydomonas sp. UWO 241]